MFTLEVGFLLTRKSSSPIFVKICEEMVFKVMSFRKKYLKLTLSSDSFGESIRSDTSYTYSHNIWLLFRNCLHFGYVCKMNKSHSCFTQKITWSMTRRILPCTTETLSSCESIVTAETFYQCKMKHELGRILFHLNLVDIQHTNAT